MDDEYNNIPYDYEPERKFDLTIPVLLLILVFLVIAWKFGWLANIPFIGGLTGGSTTSVLLVGDDTNIKSEIDKISTELNINYKVLDLKELDNVRDVDYLNQYGMIILTEKLYADNPTYLKGTFRAFLASALKSGKKLIVIGLAGSRDPQEAALNGWGANGMEDFIPVECPTFNKLCDATDPTTQTQLSKSTSKLKIYETSSPIIDGYTTTVNFLTDTGVLDVAIVNPKPGATRIVAIEDEVGGEVHPAIIEMTTGVGGKVVYFAYHPSNTPTIFKNTIKYLVGG